MAQHRKMTNTKNIKIDITYCSWPEFGIPSRTQSRNNVTLTHCTDRLDNRDGRVEIHPIFFSKSWFIDKTNKKMRPGGACRIRSAIFWQTLLEDPNTNEFGPSRRHDRDTTARETGKIKLRNKRGQRNEAKNNSSARAHRHLAQRMRNVPPQCPGEFYVRTESGRCFTILAGPLEGMGLAAVVGGSCVLWTR